MQSLSELSKCNYEILLCEDPNCWYQIPLQLSNCTDYRNYPISGNSCILRKFKNMNKKRIVPLSLIDSYSNVELSSIAEGENTKGITHLFEETDGILDIFKCCFGAIKALHLCQDGEIILK